MKLAILSDIHGNHIALQTVLAAIKHYEIDKLVVAGDFVGYYFWPRDVIELLESWDIIAIRGNHEEMLIKAENNSEYLQPIQCVVQCDDSELGFAEMEV